MYDFNPLHYGWLENYSDNLTSPQFLKPTDVPMQSPHFNIEMEEVDGYMLIPTTMKFTAPAAREWFNVRRRNIRPWSVFLNTTKFGIPPSAVVLSQRVVKNVEHFQSNYLFVFLGLVVYCLLTSPLLLLAVAACAGACYIVSLKNAESRVKILGHELNLLQQYTVVCLVSIPLFFLAGAGSAVFWVIGASFFMIMLHAAFFAVENLNRDEDSFELTMETV